MATTNLNSQNNLVENKSFAILRANPKLSTNARLVVDSSNDIYLSAFRANRTLSRAEFQKFELKETGNYSQDISRFFNKISKDDRYQILRKNDDLTVYSDYAAQYENQYAYGASFNSTKLYDEQYKILAPIWLDKVLPSKFIIYRVEGVDYEQDYSVSASGQNSRILELLRDATIIKTFDLKDSKVGKYLDNHVNNPLFPSSPLSFSFEEDEPCMYRGIDVMRGGFVDKPEYLEDEFYRKDSLEILSNELITEGFKRNGIAIANLMNLEFLFDDSTATDYKVYRYFGLFVDDIKEGSFDCIGVNRSGVVQIEPDSYETVYPISSPLTAKDMFISADETTKPILSYIKNKDGKLFHVKNLTKFKPNSIPVSLTNTEDIKSFEGLAKSKINLPCLPEKPATKGFIQLDVIAVPNHNDRFFIADKSELQIEGYNLGNFTIVADQSLPAGTHSTYRFSNQGSLEMIAVAISKAIHEGQIMEYDTMVNGTLITVKDYGIGSDRNKTAFGILGANIVNFLDVKVGVLNDIGLNQVSVPSNTNTVFSDWSIYTMTGGSQEGQALLVADIDLPKVSIGQSTKIPKSNKFIKITSIVNDPERPGFNRVVFSKQTKLASDNVIELYEDYSVEYGKFSVYDFKDFDYDFYDTTYSELGELQHESVPSSFEGLNDVLEVEDPDTEEIGASKITSEYDRLHENELKETSLVSRVVPCISKFALKDSTNARNLNYLLTANEAFGVDNMSPSVDDDGERKFESLNMEHFHINKFPDSAGFTDDSVKKNLNSYLNFTGDNSGLTLSMLKDTTNNYFDKFFIWSGAYNSSNQTWTPSTSRKLYTLFKDGTTQNFSNTTFRGVRYLYKKRKEIIDATPSDFISSGEANDYKFGVVVNYNNSSVSNSTTIDVVKNDVFKFICIYVQVFTVFNSQTSLDRTFVYEGTDFEDVNNPGNPIDTPIAAQFDFSGANWPTLGNPTQDTLLQATQFSIISETARFTEQIVPLSDGAYSVLKFNHDGNAYAIKVKSVISDSEIIVSGLPYILADYTQATPTSVLQYYPDAQLINSLTTTVEYHRGGDSGWANLLEGLTAHNFAERLNANSNVTYTTVDSLGELSNQFLLAAEGGTSFVKPSLITTGTDADKPKSFRLSADEVGKILVEREDGGYFTSMNRFNGNYTPVFKDIVTFSYPYGEHKLSYTPNEALFNPRKKLIYDKFNGLGIGFDTFEDKTKEYGHIKNFFYHKVNDENAKNILKLSQSTDKLPLYPAIGEIAIDKKDVNLFKSKYDSEYFTKSLSAGNSIKAHGTLTPSEIKSFFVSTIMKVQDFYDITSYKSTRENSLEALDEIRMSDKSVTSIHFFENPKQVFADFYLPDAIVSELLEFNAGVHLKRYIKNENSFGDKTTTDDDVVEYIKRNVVSRFITEFIRVYAFESRELEESSFLSLSNANNIAREGFVEQTNFDIKKFTSDGLSFRLIYNKKISYNYNFRIHVKIQA